MMTMHTHPQQTGRHTDGRTSRQ